MANIELIKALRDRTGAGIMDCKNALTNNGDDLDKAADWLREKGIAKSAKKASRIAAEGLTSVSICDQCGRAVIVEINCETDFVAKSDPFKELVDNCAKVILEKDPKDIEEARELTAESFTNATVKLGEKLDFRRFEVIEKKASTNGFGSYLHMGGVHGVIVLLEKEDEELSRVLAMHIAANSPVYITESNVSQSFIESETKIQMEASKNDPKLQGKPEQALIRIVEGKVHKQYAEVTLEDQSYLVDPSKTVGQVLKEKGNKVISFVHYLVGEGIEKRHEDFAAEVLKQAQ